MKCKRLASLLLSLALVLSLLAGCSGSGEQAEAVVEAETAKTVLATQANGAPIPGGEYERGIWYGFLPEELADADPDNTVVTWKQYCAMLGRMIERYQPEALAEWEAMTKDAPDTTILRDGAAMANLFAARTIGMDYFNYNPDDLYEESYSAGHHVSWDYPVFDWQSEFILEKDDYSDWSDKNAVAPAFWFLLGRVSCVNCQPTLSVENGDPHLDDSLILSDAIVSVVRLYESDEDVVVALAEKLMDEIKDTPEAQAIIQAAELRKQEILNTKTAITKSDEYIQGETYTGTAYYVTNNGNDKNDGLSPETPWASLERLGKVKFQFGDAIFFERGSIWRSAQISKYISGAEGLTLSAYGEGEKPRFYGSPENGAGAEKWELVYEGANGEKIWKFYQEMTDCSAVVLDGQHRILRDIAYFDGKIFVSIDDFSTPYVVEEQLKNMECFVQLPYTMQPVRAGDWESLMGTSIHQDANGNELTGPVYVRYDAGNPGELHENVEFIAACSAFGGMSNYTTLDNLSICYSTQTIASGYWDGVSNDNIIIQNCESGWMGGGINYFLAIENGASVPFHIDGGGFNTNGSYITLQNCYSHHIFQESSSIETFDGDPDPCTDIIIRDNVLEYITMGLVVINWEEEDTSEHQLQNVLVENNIVLYSGLESLYNHKDPFHSPNVREVDWPSRLGIKIVDSAAYSSRMGGENYTIRSNTFAFSLGTLIDGDKFDIPQKPVYEGNTYAPLPGFAVYQELETVSGPVIKENDAASAIETILGDKNATIIIFED